MSEPKFTVGSWVVKEEEEDKNYEEMSDFDLEVMVADYNGIKWHSPPKNSPNGHWLYTDKYSELEGDSVEKPKYCSSPNDAWPIIVENGISLRNLPKGGNKYALEELWVAGRFQFKTIDKNPLRAAMICFLKMKDAEKDNVL
tara:strand:- start:8486 stop:8911 length:426 start_codon:yes stop_codon:yes gene_type:complete